MGDPLRVGNGECPLCGHIHPSGFDCQHAKRQEDARFEAVVSRIGEPELPSDGWTYSGAPTEGDCRKLVTLEQDGMEWIGIRAYDHQNHRWLNNNEPESVYVKAWRDLPEIARGFWDRGKLVIAPQRAGTRR